MKNIKTYETRHGNLSTVVQVGNRHVRIRFISKDTVHGYYATTDVDLQRAIESDSGYGRKFYLLEETCSCDEKEIELKPIPYIKTWQNAKELLRKKPYSVPEYELSSPERIEKSAKKNGIVFPLLKSNL